MTEEDSFSIMAKGMLESANFMEEMSKKHNLKIELYPPLRKIIELERKEAQKEIYLEIFEKFDEYSCIKNDKWYLDWKRQKLNEVNSQ